MKYLGVYIDKQLTRKKHIEHVIQTLSNTRGTVANLETLCCYYYFQEAYIFAYCFAFALWTVHYGNGARTHLNKLPVTQNCIIKILTKSPFI